MNRRQKYYEKSKYNKGKFCLPCLFRNGEHVPVTNVSKMWCCVSCAKLVTIWCKRHPAAVSMAREQDGPRKLQLSRGFWALVDGVMTTGELA